MKKGNNRSRLDAKRDRRPPERPDASKNVNPSMHHLVPPVTSYFKGIEDLLGNFSDQTGANFG